MAHRQVGPTPNTDHFGGLYAEAGVCGTGAIRPLLRWAGSKRQLLSHLLSSAPDKFNTYFEPFAGSACVFFALNPKSAVLGDTNASLIETYHVVSRRPSDIQLMIVSWPKTTDFYYNLRSVPPEVLTATERAARFIYLNRYSFNGVYRTNRAGQFNVPRGVRTGEVPSLHEFEECARALKRAALVNADFEHLVAKTKRGDFLYLDPPYRPAEVRHRGEYGYNSFSLDDLDRLVSSVRDASARGVQILMSYFDSVDLKRRFSDWRVRQVPARRHVSGFALKRQQVRELLVSNY